MWGETMSPLTKCDSCGEEIRKNKSGLCKDCYQKSPKQKEQYSKMSATSKETRAKNRNFADWRILRDKKRLVVGIETKIEEHQAFVYKILGERIKEVKEDFQRKSFTYWKLNEIIEFLEEFQQKP